MKLDEITNRDKQKVTIFSVNADWSNDPRFIECLLAKEPIGFVGISTGKEEIKAFLNKLEMNGLIKYNPDRNCYILLHKLYIKHMTRDIIWEIGSITNETTWSRLQGIAISTNN